MNNYGRSPVLPVEFCQAIAPVSEKTSILLPEEPAFCKQGQSMRTSTFVPSAQLQNTLNIWRKRHIRVLCELLWFRPCWKDICLFIKRTVTSILTVCCCRFLNKACFPSSVLGFISESSLTPSSKKPDFNWELCLSKDRCFQAWII